MFPHPCYLPVDILVAASLVALFRPLLFLCSTPVESDKAHERRFKTRKSQRRINTRSEAPNGLESHENGEIQQI